MTKEELIEIVAQQEKIPQAKARRIVTLITSELIEQVRVTGRFHLAGVGVFKKVYQAPRRVTPGYGDKQPKMIPGRFTVRLKVHPAFKELINP